VKRSVAGLLLVLALLLPGCDDHHDHHHHGGFVVNTSAADLNLDGFADLVIGSPLHPGAGTATSKRGAVFIHLGGPNGPSATPDLTIFGTEDGAQFGSSLAFVGDVNAHGAPDLLVGAPLDDGDGDNSDSGVDRGRAFVFFGGPSMDDNPDVTMTGAEDKAHFGASVARIADTNGDGFDDWIVGAPLDDGDGNATDSGADRGRAFFFYGSSVPDNVPDVVFTGSEDKAQFGAAVESAGDLNNGGAEDIAVGAPLDDGDANTTDSGADRGRVFVFFGGTNLDPTPDLTLTGDQDDAHFGAAVAPALDVNADGIDDLLVGAPLHDAGGPGNADRGRAYVFFGGNTPDATPDVTISGTVNNGTLGAAVSRAGDVNGDGRRDFLVGAPHEHPGSLTDAGSAYLFFGGPAVDGVFDLAFDGAEAGAQFGASLAGPGDFNGGGRDVIIGAPLDDADGNSTDDHRDRGSAFLFSGGSASVLDDTDDKIIDGTLDGAHAATAIAN
jgi:FG-GAP repeat